jgi:dihydroxyacetone kinase-like protein
MKKLINAVEDVVPEALAGMAAAYPDLLRADLDARMLLRRQPPQPGKVALVSGGGSGHEPLHGGYVGFGMLDAACAGAIFTSPVPDQILAATTAVDGGAGVLHIVKNYTGDVLSFETAAELAEAEGVRVASVTISDDVAVRDSTYTVGRRGVGATVLAEKIAGAAAERGDDLDAVAAICSRAAAAARSMGMALTSCSVPAVGKPTFDLPEDQMEIGIGIHGEPGRYREPLAPARAVVERLTQPIVEDLGLRAGERVLAFVNGMGATPLIELFVVYNDLARHLAERGILIARSLVGNYITSLDMAGCSITLLRLDEELEALWDAPVHSPALRWGM